MDPDTFGFLDELSRVQAHLDARKAVLANLKCQEAVLKAQLAQLDSKHLHVSRQRSDAEARLLDAKCRHTARLAEARRTCQRKAHLAARALALSTRHRTAVLLKRQSALHQAEVQAAHQSDAHFVVERLLRILSHSPHHAALIANANSNWLGEPFPEGEEDRLVDIASQCAAHYLSSKGLRAQPPPTQQ